MPIALAPAGEPRLNRADELPALCAVRGIEWFHLPMADEQGPLDDFDSAWMQRHLAPFVEGRRIAIRFRGGSGCTGTSAAHPDRPCADAIACCRRRAPGPSGACALNRTVRPVGDGRHVMLKTLALFVLTALAEILGCHLPWLWLREGRSAWLPPPGALCLALFAWLLSAAGRVYAAYGGVYICVALLWLWLVDGIRPTVWDLFGGGVALAGMAIIVLAPRSP
ncbi:hypothetical protein AvCA_25900 [Azotobacter vinelandii CA]|uniref:Uncharacterized protein n=3 Tax=Azotobacter group TaxID=351 RepID=C1DJK0_AZOVD|nr:conserved hypothetical protein [Azotobacter vinelandii DJ]AGK16619.1 hypothetical protein AvCA_25900 [Azotobacter vinelandii CA]AGK20732.1 hypothetical protein AvCA6_25900 [Azotobacter vinelandii CA6]GLK60119.1 hypothetical protein GCM10017624_22780 [Azotobacter vinelandii]